MTEDEIKKLARSAAEEMYKGYKEMNIALMEEEFKMLISFILKEYCIVEKEKVKTEYDFWHQRLPKMCRLTDKVNNDPDTARMWGKIEVLNDIFGKEMFEEGKK